jgi:glutamate N-acetyltransferase/amino-acid N-acetyltransferase
MPVNTASLQQTPCVPEGFHLSGIHCGIKSDPDKEDLTLILSDRPAVAAGVYTENLIRAAPVELDQSRTPSSKIRATVINSGNANACTGSRGREDAEKMCRLLAESCGLDADQVLVMSTGIIGSYLPMEAIRAGISLAAKQLASDERALLSAARGMMTTDTVPKIASCRLPAGDPSGLYTITGLAKGAAMIGPRMATMLGIVLTDAAISPALAQPMLAEIVEETFNCIHVDGHMSTNDTVLLLANGAARADVSAGDARAAFREGLYAVCAELARSIPADGEGATHLITITVRGSRDESTARTIARTIANSPLVKTAIAGADPNWGRIVSAAGYAGVPFDPARMELKLNGYRLFSASSPVDFPADEVSQSIRDNREVSIELTFAEGAAQARFWTTDLTADYVRLNTDYPT